MRKVKFREDGIYNWKIGYFHQWGLAGFEEVRTMGIIEDETGQVYFIYPYNIIFTEPIDISK